MAAHVFDAAEPGIGSKPDPVVSNASSSAPAATAMADGPMFAAQPAVFHRMQQKTRVGAGPVIGLVVGAALIGGLVFSMTRHDQGDNGATTGIHTSSQPPAASAAAQKPVPSPATGQPNPAPAHATVARATPNHLQIVAAPPPRAAPPARTGRAPARCQRAEGQPKVRWSRASDYLEQ